MRTTCAERFRPDRVTPPQRAPPCETALQLDPHDTSAYANLALLELETGNPEAAARLFAEVLSLDPSSCRRPRRTGQRSCRQAASARAPNDRLQTIEFSTCAISL